MVVLYMVWHIGSVRTTPKYRGNEIQPKLGNKKRRFGIEIKRFGRVIYPVWKDKKGVW